VPTLETEAAQLAASYQPPPTGRPCFLGDVDTVRELLTQISLGNRRETACAIAGISVSTLQLWLAKAREYEADPDSPEVAFLKLLKRAEAIAEARVVGNVLKASEKEAFWAAGMTYLERKHPEAWGKRSEDGNSPKVIVQIGVQATDVSVTLVSGVSAESNHNAAYQTQTLGEGEQAQVLPAPQRGATQAKGRGRKSGKRLARRTRDGVKAARQAVDGAPSLTGLALPAVSRGRGLTGPGGVEGGMAPDGCGVLKAPGGTAGTEKKGTG